MKCSSYVYQFSSRVQDPIAVEWLVYLKEMTIVQRCNAMEMMIAKCEVIDENENVADQEQKFEFLDQDTCLFLALKKSITKMSSR